MGQKEFGQTYFSVLSAIKDGIAGNLLEESGKLGLSKEQLSKLIYVTQSAVDTVGGGAFNALSKSEG